MRDAMQQAKRMLETGLVLFLVGLMAVGPWVPRAWAGPELQEVVHGEIGIEVSTDDGITTTTIDSSAVSIGNYGNFDIGENEVVEVLFSGMSEPQNGRHLARVMNGIETQILGDLLSEGHVYVVNPAGVFIGAGGVIDVAGFHAAAGDIDESAFLDAAVDRDHYTNLVGEIRNYGEINARIVDLVGRYVLNAQGAAIHHVPDPEDGLTPDGFFVLVAGEDVIVSRRAPTGGAARERDVTVTITGLAKELLDALDTGEEVGVEQNGEVNANDADAAFEQASVGQVVVGAAAELGSGDLAGLVMFGSQSRTLAQDIMAMSRGGNLEIAGSDSGGGAYFDAETVELCAGEICGTSFVDQGSEGGDLDRVVIEDGAVFDIRVPKDYESDGSSGDLVGQFTLRQDADLEFDLEVGDTIKAEQGLDEQQAPLGPLVDLDIQSRGQLTLTANLKAREITLTAGLDEERAGDLVLGSDGEDITLRGEVISLRAGDGEGSPDDAPAEQASIQGVNDSTFEFVDYRDEVRQSLTLEQDAAIVVGWDEAGISGFDPDALSTPDPDHDLVLISADEVMVGAFEPGETPAEEESLTVDGLTLRSGTDLTGHLVIGKWVGLNADRFLLEAGSRTSSGSAVVTIDEDAEFGARVPGEQIERFHVYQHGDIGVDALPSLSGQDAPAVFEIESSRGSIAFDDDAAQRILGEADPADDVYRGDTELVLSTGGKGSIFLQPSLELRGLSVGNGVVTRNYVTSASLETSADMSFQGEVTIFDREDANTGAGEGDQTIHAGGTLGFLGGVEKASGGSLILEADGNPSDVDTDGGQGEICPIVFEAGYRYEIDDWGQLIAVEISPDVVVENGDLVIGSGFWTQGSISVGMNSSSSDEPHTFTIASPDGVDELVGEFRCTTSCAGDDDIYADRLIIQPNGSTVTLQSSVASVSAQGEISWLPGGELRLSSEGDLTIGAEDGEDNVRMIADQITLRAGSEGEPDPEHLAAVAFNPGIEFQTDSFSLIEDATITSSMLPDSAAFTTLTSGGAMSYRVESTRGTVEIAAGETQLGGHILRGWNVAVAAYDSIQVLGTLIADAISIHAGKGNEAGADLVLGEDGGATALLMSDSILLRAGVGDDDAAKTGSRVIVNDADLVAPVGSSLQLTLQQDAAIDGTTKIQDVAEIIRPGPDMTYRLISDGDGIDLSDQGFATRLGSGSENGVCLELEAAEEITIGTDLSFSSLSAHAGTGGDADHGDLIIEEGLVLRAAEFELQAGTLLDSDQAIPVGTDEQAPAVKIGEGARFGGAWDDERDAYGPIARFALEQDASVGAAQLTHAHFEPDPGVPEELRIASARGGVEAHDVALISHTGLDIEALGGVSLGDAGSGPTLALRSLELVTGQGAALHQSILAMGTDGGEVGTIDIQGDVAFDGSGQRRLLAQAGGRISIQGNLEYRPDDPGSSTLILMASDGQIEVTGTIDTRGDPGSAEDEGVPRDGTGVQIRAGGVDVGAIGTAGADGGDGGAVEILASADQDEVGISIRDHIYTFDSSQPPDLQGQAGAVRLEADLIQVGSAVETDPQSDFAQAEGESQSIFIEAGDVVFDGKVVSAVPAADPLVAPARRNLIITSQSGSVEFAGQLGSAEQEGRLDQIEVTSAGDVLFADQVWLRDRESTGSSGETTGGGLTVLAQGDVELGGDIVAGTVKIHAGDAEDASTGDPLPGELNVLGDITADQITLRVGNGPGEGDRKLNIEGVAFRAREGSLAPEVTLHQEAGFSAEDTDAIIQNQILVANGINDERPDVRVGFLSDNGTVTVNADTVTGMRLQLEGSDTETAGVFVEGSLEVRELDLDSDAHIQGDLRVTGPSTAYGRVDDRAGLRVQGDLTVTGDVELLTLLRLDGDLEDAKPVGDGETPTQTLTVEGGGLIAPAIERVSSPVDVVQVVIETQDDDEDDYDVELRGTLRNSSFASGIQSADISHGSLSFNSDVLALGDLEAQHSLTFAKDTGLYLDEKYGSHKVSHDQIVLARDGRLEVDGPVNKQGSSGPLGYGSLVFGGGSGFEIRQPDLSEPPPDPIDLTDWTPISAVGDLTLVGPGDIATAAGQEGTIRSEQGELALVGGLTWTGGDLKLDAGDGEPDNPGDDRSILLSGTVDVGEGAITLANAVRTDLLAAEHLAEAIGRESLMPEESRPDSARIVGGRVDFMDTIQGDASLSVDAGSGSIELRGDVDLLGSATLALHSSAEGGIRFSKPEQDEWDDTQLIRAGSIELNPYGQTPTLLASIVRDQGDLRLEASDDRLVMGAGTRMSVVGDLVMNAARSAQLADLSAFRIDVTAPSIGVISRPPAAVALPLPGGSTVLDGGTDIVANWITMSTQPVNLGGGLISFGTPTGTEIGDEAWSDDVQMRSIHPDLRSVSDDDFRCEGGTCDLVARGPARFEAARELEEAPRPVGLQGRQALAEFNAVGVSARPLWAEELLAHLERASLGGDVLTPVQSDDPRLDRPGVSEAVRIYRNLFAPTALYDQTTGTRTLRSHRGRIRDVLGRAIADYRAGAPGAPLDGSSFVAFLEGGQRGEALFYLSTLGDLVGEARRAGLSDVEAERFARLLAEDITPDGVEFSELAAAILASEPGQESDPGVAVRP